MNTYKTIGGLILAAGNGARMGKPKIRLILDGKSFVQHIIEKLDAIGVGKTVCIVRKEDTDWVTSISHKLSLLPNDDPNSGMMASIKIGVAGMTEMSGIFVIPVDHPMVTESTYRKLAVESFNNPDCVIKPKFKESSGHPIIIPRSLYKVIENAAEGFTLNEVIKTSSVKQMYIQSDDYGILKNINTPADFR